MFAAILFMCLSKPFMHGFDILLLMLHEVISSLHAEFAMPEMGILNYFLGIFAQHTIAGLFLSQATYAEEILERAHMESCKPCRTSLPTDSKIGPNDDHVCLYMHDPRGPYFSSLKRILRYVRGTLDYSLQMHVSTTSQLTAYTDVDWADCLFTHRSTSDYCVFLEDNLLSWSTKRQTPLSIVVAETPWVRNLFCELHLHAPVFNATLVYYDHVRVVYLSNNPVQHQRTKHIELDIHFVRDFVAKGLVRAMHGPSRFQYADIFTKGLSSALFQDFCLILNVRRPLSPTIGCISRMDYEAQVLLV
ncbi:ribonuclease H-like domain-containing protein [Tanacetum coccineum]